MYWTTGQSIERANADDGLDPTTIMEGIALITMTGYNFGTLSSDLLAITVRGASCQFDVHSDTALTCRVALQSTDFLDSEVSVQTTMGTTQGKLA